MLSKKFLTFVVLILFGLLWGCGGPRAAKPERGFALPAGDVAAGQKAFVDLKCYTCHEVEGLTNGIPRPTANPQVDVPLGGLAMREPTDGELVTAIVNPPHELYPGGEEQRITSDGGSRMANYNGVITVQQMIDLVAFLHERYETARPEN
jgi:sulfur-oxidizing protein SoxX